MQLADACIPFRLLVATPDNFISANHVATQYCAAIMRYVTGFAVFDREAVSHGCNTLRLTHADLMYSYPAFLYPVSCLLTRYFSSLPGLECR